MAALVVPDLDNPYFAELARKLIEAARHRGYTLMIEQTDGVRDRERELLARACWRPGASMSSRSAPSAPGSRPAGSG